MWWLPIAEFFGKIVLKFALGALEKKYPGIAPVLQDILAWLEGQKASGNGNAVRALGDHVDSLISVVPAPGEIKSDHEAGL